MCPNTLAVIVSGTQVQLPSSPEKNQGRNIVYPMLIGLPLHSNICKHVHTRTHIHTQKHTHTSTHTHVTTINEKEAVNFKQSKREYMGEFRGRKRTKEMICL